MLASCGGGGDGDTTPLPGEAFSLLITADPTVGEAPLTTTFAAVPSGGVAPYTYSWDFNGDGVADSNAQSGTYIYTLSAQARVVVTDANGSTVQAQRSIIITGNSNPPVGQNLDVRFTADPTLGSVPFNVSFDAVISGGKAPYSYAWDFDADGTFDSFLKAPLFTFTKVGNKISDNLYVHYPVLRVTDSRGVVGTNLDDNNNDGNPDFRVAINALPTGGGMFVTASANPTNGQAPLTVEFNAGVGGVSGSSVEYRWDFGDGQTSAYSVSSLASHIYANPGTFTATVTARDNASGQIVTSSPVTINATPQQTFGLTISADVSSGAVPFLVSMTANPVNGTEPIVYRWNVFNNVPDGDGNPGIGGSPGLSGAAVVTPDESSRKNPKIHIGNTAGVAGAFDYAVRCIATDAQGNQTASNVVRITAQPRTNPTDNAPGYYEAQRPNIVALTTFPILSNPQGSANPVFVAVNPPVPWGARANPAVCSHPSGVTFIMGGEVLDANGRFQGLVSPGDAAYAYVPRKAATGSDQASVGKWNQGGGMVLLNDGASPSFPGIPDSPPPPQLDPQQPPAMPPPSVTNRSAPFDIVGSAAAVFIHENVETNAEGNYAAEADTDPTGIDQPFWGIGHYAVPDDPGAGWQLSSAMTKSGLGVPVVYVLGGRTAANSPTDLVQKYSPFGFGTEDLIPWSNDLGCQITNNQVDTWSPYFLRPDQDQYVGPGQNFDPSVSQRISGIGDTGLLPVLPKPAYGLMAVSIETGRDRNNSSFPNGPYHYVFTFGGIDEGGSVMTEARWWDTSIAAEQATNDGETEGLFSLLPAMPTSRAYGKAVLIPSNPIRIALVGGFDDNGTTLNNVDIFTFDNAFNPSTGTWNTYAGTLPEALEAMGAGYNPGPGGQHWVLAMGGWTGNDFNTTTYTARIGSPGNLVISEAMPVAPRFALGSSQSGAGASLATPCDFNRFYLIGGQDENAVENIIEVVSLP
ncbi:PKD domain-containing protein [bacterium]|nr:PKD domain-containing protein [bacterium]